MRIELYIESKKVIVEGKNPYYNTAAGKNIVGMWHSRSDDCQFVKKANLYVSEKENKIKNELEIIASKHGFELNIFDISKTRDALGAFFKGVRETPTVIIGKNKLVGDITEEQLTKVLMEQSKT